MNEPISSASALGSRLARAFSGMPAARAMRLSNAASIAVARGSDAAVRAIGAGEGVERNGDGWRDAETASPGSLAGSISQLSGRCVAGCGRGAFAGLKKGVEISKLRQSSRGLMTLARGAITRRRGLLEGLPFADRRARGQRLDSVRIWAPLDRHCYDVGAYVQPIAVLQKIWGVKPVRRAVEESAVGRNIAQPISTFLETNLTMLARDDSASVREGPVEMRVAPEIKPAPVHLDLQRSLRQAIDPRFRSKVEESWTHPKQGKKST